MSALRDELRSLLAQHGLAPNRRLGQHFMVDAGVLRDLVTALAPAPGELVVEVGPGTGFLTRLLLAAGCRVLAVEIDSGLAALLREIVPAGDLRLVHGDALASKQRLHPAIEAAAAAGPWSLCANLPYDASIPIILDALALPRAPRSIVVTVQREAAERLVSAPGTAAWGASAAVAQAAGTGAILRRVSPSSFHPPPRVGSAVLRWVPQRSLPPGFPAWCRGIFAYRRKRAIRALQDLGAQRSPAEDCCRAAGVDPTVRIERLTVAQLLRLFAHWRCPPAAAGARRKGRPDTQEDL